MRHLTTDELLLYAERELDVPGLCRHVRDCVDCKARLVDIQETYVHATTLLRSRVAASAAQSTPMDSMRTRLAAEAQLMAVHLDTEDLLLSVENQLGGEREEHLKACVACQDRAADLHVQLAEIECQLHARLASELPAERRSVALSALRERLAREVEIQTVAARRWSWVPSLRLPTMPTLQMPQMPAFAPYAAAGAVACLVAWVGWNALSGTAGSDSSPDTRAEVVVAQAVPGVDETADSILSELASLPSTVPVVAGPARFDWVPASRPGHGPERPLELAAVPAPRVKLEAPPATVLALEPLPTLASLPAPQASSPRYLADAVRLPLPERMLPPAVDSPSAVVEGNWLLAKAGLWRQGLEAGGSGGVVRFSGSVRSESERVAVERKLRTLAGGLPVEFALVVRSGGTAAVDLAPSVRDAGRPSGGIVRNSLLQHYEDSARRSFQVLDQGLLEGELDRYVSDIFRHESDLLAHVHALHRVLNRSGGGTGADASSLKRVARFHLDGIARHEKDIYDQLSEALPRAYWAHRGVRNRPPAEAGLGDLSRGLLQDALALDRALTGMFFDSGEALDARTSNLSSADLLLSVRQHVGHLRAALKRSVD